MNKYYRIFYIDKENKETHYGGWKPTIGLKTSDIIRECKELESAHADCDYLYWFETTNEIPVV